MNIKSNLSGHWTDEQLIQHLYGIGPEEDHLKECSGCRERLSAMLASRRALEAESSQLEEVPFDLLAAQRRSIYSRIAGLSSWRVGFEIRRWVAAVAVGLSLGGGALLLEQKQHRQIVQNKESDAQLAQEVSRMAQDLEPSPTAPLQGLFE